MGKLSIRKNIRAVAKVMPYGKGKDVIWTIPDWDFQVGKRLTAKVMPYGKGKDVIWTIPDWDFQVGKRLTINEPKFRGPVGELLRARRSRRVAPRCACGR